MNFPDNIRSNKTQRTELTDGSNSTPGRSRPETQEDQNDKIAAIGQMLQSSPTATSSSSKRKFSTSIDIPSEKPSPEPAAQPSSESSSTDQADDYETHMQKGYALMEEEEYSEADDEFIEAHRLNPTHVDPLMAMARIAETEEDFKTARDFYRDVINMDSNNAHAYLGIGRCFYDDSKMVKRPFLQALKLDTQIPLANWYLGMIAIAEESFKKAERYFLKELGISPHDKIVYESLAHVAILLKEWEKAECYFKAQEKRYPFTYKQYYLLGNVLSKQGKYEEAMVYYQKASLETPEDIHEAQGFANALLATLQDTYNSSKKNFPKLHTLIWKRYSPVKKK